MADNITVTPGTGATIAAENLSGALVQRVKVVLGNLDVDNGDISATNQLPIAGTDTAGTSAGKVLTTQGAGIGAIPMPVYFTNGLVAGSAAIGSITNTSFIATQSTGSNLHTVIDSGSVTATISGTPNVAVTSSALPTGASTSALQTTGNSSLSSIDSKTPALGQTTMTNSAPVTIASNQSAIPVTGTFYQATQPISGSVSVSNFPASQAVTGTFYQATQPVSAVSLPLPTGAATSAKQPAFSTVGTSSTDVLTIQGAAGAVAIPCSVSSLPLPTGAATAALQSSEITILNTIATNTGAQATDFLVTGTITSNTGSVSVYGQGVYTVTINISGTWSGASLPVQGLMADGTTWVNLPIYTVGSSLPYQSSFGISSNGQYMVMGGGYQTIRVYGTGYASGTVNVALDGSLAQQANFAAQMGVWNINNISGTVSLPTGAATSALQTTGNASLATIAANTIVSTTASPWIASLVDGQRPTYSSSVISLAAANNATDIFSITGSASKTVRVTRIGICATQTTAGYVTLQLAKRSSVNSTGTAITAVPHDSSSSSATALVQSYTANPGSLGALVGYVRSLKLFAPTTTTAGVNTEEFDFGNTPSQAIVLRGASQVLAINLNATTYAGNNFSLYVEWTEDNS